MLESLTLASLDQDLGVQREAVDVTTQLVGDGEWLDLPAVAEPGDGAAAVASQGDAALDRGGAELGQQGLVGLPIDAAEIHAGGHGADIGPLMRDGVPGLSLDTVGEHYFDWHHTEADTLDKVELADFRKAVGLLAVMGYVLADMPETLVAR